MLFTAVRGLMPHILWQYAKGWVYFLLMGCLFWGMPYILPTTLAYFRGTHELSAEELYWLPINHWWVYCVIFYVVAWLSHEGGQRMLLRGRAQGMEYLNVRLLVMNLARRAQLSYTPEVIVIDGRNANAAATQGILSRGVVLVSGAILAILDDGEEEIVFGHEVAHLKHLDVPMMLLASVGNTAFRFQKIMLFLCMLYTAFTGMWAVFWLLLLAHVTVTGVQVVYTLLMLAFSRCREYLADAGGVALAGWDRRNELATGLVKLFMHADRRMSVLHFLQMRSGMEIFMMHPLPMKRLAALKVTAVVYTNGEVEFVED